MLACSETLRTANCEKSMSSSGFIPNVGVEGAQFILQLRAHRSLPPGDEPERTASSCSPSTLVCVLRLMLLNI